VTAAAPRVGDTLTTAEQLDALPDGVIVMLPTSKVPAVRFEDVWFVPGFEEGQPSSGLRLPTTVLYVPGEQPADRPSVTDNACAEAWAEGHRTGWEHCQDGNYGNDHWDDPTPNPYAAAARAETTDERVVHNHGPTDGPGLDCPETILPDGGLRGACLNRAETTTATTEDAARAIAAWALDFAGLGVGIYLNGETIGDPHGPWDVPTDAADSLAAWLNARGLLATAHTRPTREQVIDALVMSPLSDTAGTDMRPFEQTADAVMELLRGGA